MNHLPGYYRDMDLTRFASLVRAAALEEAAKACEATSAATGDEAGPFYSVPLECAAAIRALIPGYLETT